MRTISIIVVMLFSMFSYAQEYTSHQYVGLRHAFGTLQNPYTNGSLKDFTEKMNVTMLEYSIEGMDKNLYVNFKTDFFGIIPDYLIKALNKKNRKLIYGALMEEFHNEYNANPQQYEFNASFSDWDVMSANISYGYKYIFAGVNFAWANTSIDAYQSVSNIKITKQEPANYFGFNERGNFTFGGNIVLWNNSTQAPIRLICAYDLLLMRDYSEKWTTDMGNRLSFDLQATIPFRKDSDNKKAIYVGATYRMYDIDYKLSVNSVEFSKDFTANIASIKLGYSW